MTTDETTLGGPAIEGQPAAPAAPVDGNEVSKDTQPTPKVSLTITLDGDQISIEGPTTAPIMTLQLLRMAEDVMIDTILRGKLPSIADRPQVGVLTKQPKQEIVIPRLA